MEKKFLSSKLQILILTDNFWRKAQFTDRFVSFLKSTFGGHGKPEVNRHRVTLLGLFDPDLYKVLENKAVFGLTSDFPGSSGCPGQSLVRSKTPSK